MKRIRNGNSGKKIAEINEIGERTEYGYHYNGLLAYIYLPDGKAIYYDYNDYGQLTHFTSAFGDEWQLTAMKMAI